MQRDLQSASKSDAAEIFRLDSKTIVVTGAARGMGLALVSAFAQTGARVVLADIDGEGAEREALRLREEGREAVGIAVDHTDEAAVDRMVAYTQAAFGDIDVLVNNAGVLSLYDLFDMKMEDWDRVLNINLRGPLLCMKKVMPGMTSRRSGSVINIGSTWSSRASIFNQPGGGPDYCASKAALQALTKSAAQAAAPYGVRVNAIGPGVVDTPMHAAHRELLFTRLDWIPLGRLQEPDDIVGAAIFLASEASRYMTGQTIHVNGGLIMVD